MAGLGHDVHMIFSRAGQTTPAISLPYTVHWARYHEICDKAMDFVGQAAILAGILAHSRFDIVFCHGENAFLFPWICQFKGVPMDAVFHPVRMPAAPKAWNLTGSGGLLADLDYHMLRTVLLRSRRIHVFSERSREVLTRMMPTRYADLLNCVPAGVTGDWLSLPQHEPRHAGEPPRLVTWSRLEPIKGLPILLEAFAEVRRVHSNATLTVIGEGSQHTKLEQQAILLGGGVHFLGKRSPMEIQELCGDFHLAVFPTLGESFGLAIAEAAASGLPVVASDVGSVPEVLEHGAIGRLVPPGNSKALTATILDVLSRPGEHSAIARQARLSIGRRFDWTRSALAMLGER